VCHRGQDLARGAAVLAPGQRLRAADLAVLASVGADPVPVFARPRVAIWTSGDELVPPSALPGPGQIREGNTLHLAALARAAEAEVVDQGIVRDDPEALTGRFARALERCDALVTTGGVSMGEYDFVGRALERAGVVPVFHKVAIKPGKPLWFGMRGAVPVFALPGNPVSCLVNHVVFVAPALALLGGERRAERRLRGLWAGPPTLANPREQHVPVALEVSADAVVRLVPVPWNGSADVVGLARAEALAVVPSGAVLRPGDPADYQGLA
jgi:molybdopterin molybdotransferase